MPEAERNRPYTGPPAPSGMPLPPPPSTDPAPRPTGKPAPTSRPGPSTSATTDLRTRFRYWQAGQPLLVTKAIIAINVAVFLGLGLLYDLPGMLSGQITEGHVRFALSPEAREASLVGDRIFIGPDTEWFRLVTSGFLHYGLIHIGMNMYFLWLLGNEIEPNLGRIRFTLLYFAGLLGGSTGVLLLDSNSFTAGASGAVFGLLGAYAVSVWQHGINVFRTQIGTLLLINLFLTFAISNISIGGHLGGLVAGGISGFVVLAPGWKGFPRWATWATPLAVCAVCLGLSVALVA